MWAGPRLGRNRSKGFEGFPAPFIQCGAMEATRIIAVRHGETPWNVDSRIQGQLDIQLNDTGRWQARRVGQALCGEQLSAIAIPQRAIASKVATTVMTGLTVLPLFTIAHR